MPIDLICLDADDTLWHNERFFRLTQQRFGDALRPYADPQTIETRLSEIEHRNLAVYGYGVKGFTLSMLETALEVTRGHVPTAIMAEILSAGRELMRHPVDLLPGVAEALETLAAMGRLVLVTKGDLFHQESKLAASGLGARFSGIEIVSDKVPETYRRIFARHGATPGTSLMAGNSVRSDILPALEAGAHAALIPYELVWSHEATEAPQGHARFRQLASLGDLPGWLSDLARTGQDGLS
ncbi:MAG TPA: HAD family hydrolase [Lichenihabitans sp.]|jgi:putative hydrolase of the HAD superfamily|nr:HAD family hydrolase [Lichenihabitans sp.]